MFKNKSFKNELDLNTQNTFKEFCNLRSEVIDINLYFNQIFLLKGITIG